MQEKIFESLSPDDLEHILGVGYDRSSAAEVLTFLKLVEIDGINEEIKGRFPGLSDVYTSEKMSLQVRKWRAP